MGGAEVRHLVGALDRQRATYRWKPGGRDAAGLISTPLSVLRRSALANGGLDQPAHIEFGDRGHLGLRRLLFDLLEAV